MNKFQLLINKCRQSLTFLETLDDDENEEAERLIKELETTLNDLRAEWPLP
jgi:hypothetical protein